MKMLAMIQQVIKRYQHGTVTEVQGPSDSNKLFEGHSGKELPGIPSIEILVEEF